MGRELPSPRHRTGFHCPCAASVPHTCIVPSERAGHRDVMHRRMDSSDVGVFSWWVQRRSLRRQEVRYSCSESVVLPVSRSIPCVSFASRPFHPVPSHVTSCVVSIGSVPFSFVHPNVVVSFLVPSSSACPSTRLQLVVSMLVPRPPSCPRTSTSTACPAKACPKNVRRCVDPAIVPKLHVPPTVGWTTHHLDEDPNTKSNRMDMPTTNTNVIHGERRGATSVEGREEPKVERVESRVEMNKRCGGGRVWQM